MPQASIMSFPDFEMPVLKVQFHPDGPGALSLLQEPTRIY